MSVELTVFVDPATLGEALASEIADGIALATACERRYVLGCPGGRSARTTYQMLAREVGARDLNLSGLVIALMDDYVVNVEGSFVAVPSDAHYSVRNFAETEIVAPLNAAAGPGRGITSDRVWSPDPADPTSYDARLRDAGGLDLFILASGDSDGHVAFNPPGTPEDAYSRVVQLPESTRRDNLGTFPGFQTLNDVPTHGVTVGVATIAELSRRVVLIASGKTKRRALMRATSAVGYEPDWPATIVVTCCNPAVFTDRSTAYPSTQRYPPLEGTPQ
jgi:glucosamine-6-phosphate deaminase